MFVKISRAAVSIFRAFRKNNSTINCRYALQLSLEVSKRHRCILSQKLHDVSVVSICMYSGLRPQYPPRYGPAVPNPTIRSWSWGCSLLYMDKRIRRGWSEFVRDRVTWSKRPAPPMWFFQASQKTVVAVGDKSQRCQVKWLMARYCLSLPASGDFSAWLGYAGETRSARQWGRPNSIDSDNETIIYIVASGVSIYRPHIWRKKRPPWLVTVGRRFPGADTQRYKARLLQWTPFIWALWKGVRGVNHVKHLRSPRPVQRLFSSCRFDCSDSGTMS